MMSRRLPPTPALLIVLASVLAGCDGSTEPLRPGRATAASPGQQSAIVGTAVQAAPAVRVETASGRPVPGATVSFQVTAGDGVLTGATRQTDENGVATAGEWRLGTVAGDNAVVASVAGLPDSPVTFRATGTAGAPARLVVVTEPPVVAARATPLSPAPAVQLVDEHGNAAAVSGIAVTATAVPAGDLMNPVAVTGVTGLATFTGLAFVQGPGSYALAFTAPGFTAATSSAAVNVLAEAPTHCFPARPLDFSLGQTIRVPLGAADGFACLDFAMSRNAGQQYLLMLENLPPTGVAAAGLFPGPASASSFGFMVSLVPPAPVTGMAAAAMPKSLLRSAAPARATHSWDFGAGPIYEIQPVEPPGGVPAPQLLRPSGQMLDINSTTPAVGDTVIIYMERTPEDSAGTQRALVRFVSDELIIAEDVRLPTLRRADGGFNTPLHPDTLRAIGEQYAALARVQGDLLFQGRHNAATEAANGGRVLAVHSVMYASNIWGYTYSSTNYFVWDYWVGQTQGHIGGLNQRVERNTDNLFMHEIAHMRHVGLLQRSGVPLPQRGNTWLVEGFARFTERLPIAARLLGTQDPSRTSNIVLPRNPAFGTSYFRDDVPTFLNASASMLQGYQNSSFVFDYLADQVALGGGDWRAAVREFLVAAGSQAALDAATTRLAGITFGDLFTRARLALYLDDIGTPGLPSWTQYHQYQLRASRPAGTAAETDPRNAWPKLAPGAAQQLEGALQAGTAQGIIIDGTAATADAILGIIGPGTPNAVLSVTRIQ
jgi:hypothetical protein